MVFPIYAKVVGCWLLVVVEKCHGTSLHW